jgi:hypothetical protein
MIAFAIVGVLVVAAVAGIGMYFFLKTVRFDNNTNDRKNQ